jgi:hypothetical protein
MYRFDVLVMQRTGLSLIFKMSARPEPLGLARWLRYTHSLPHLHGLMMAFTGTVAPDLVTAAENEAAAASTRGCAQAERCVRWRGYASCGKLSAGGRSDSQCFAATSSG